MAFFLAAMSGRWRGAFWPIGEHGVLVGRGTSCDVMIPDAVVSRKHCRIFLHAGEVRIEDCESRNPTLVNGHVIRSGPLHPGDELAIGRESFLVIADVEHAPRTAEKKDPATMSWAALSPFMMPLDQASDVDHRRPRTVQDLILLFEAARELNGCEDVPAFTQVAGRFLEQRFQPSEYWTALVDEAGEITLCAGDGADAPFDAMRKAAETRVGALYPETLNKGDVRVRAFTLIAPVVLRDATIGLFALRTAVPHGVYDEEDLRFLVLLAQSVAPILAAVQHIEQLHRDHARLRARAGESEALLGESRGIRRVRVEIRNAAKSGLPVLITGETGVGKELAARMVHGQSGRRGRPFIIVNCAAISRELFESAVFGHKAGAFTGAVKDKTGYLAQAHGGMLFLDEIGDLSLEHQARILRAVDQGTFRPVGAQEDQRVDVRVIAATNRDLAAAIGQGLFREDLYHRLHGYGIHIPPLRERKGDIPILAQHFFEMAREQAKRPLSGFDPEAMEALTAYSWPGNVRELRSCVFRATVIARGEAIHTSDLGLAQGGTATALPLLTLAELEKRHISDVLHRCGGSMAEAAKILNIARSTLYVKIAQYQIK